MNDEQFGAAAVRLEKWKRAAKFRWYRHQSISGIHWITLDNTKKRVDENANDFAVAVDAAIAEWEVKR